MATIALLEEGITPSHDVGLLLVADEVEQARHEADAVLQQSGMSTLWLEGGTRCRRSSSSGGFATYANRIGADRVPRRGMAHEPLSREPARCVGSATLQATQEVPRHPGDAAA